MIAYGKNKKFRYNYPDNHPKKGWVNWWEVELGNVVKGSARQQAKIEINKDLENIDNQYININIKNKKRKREIRWLK